MSLRAERSNPAEPDCFVGAASSQWQTPSVIDSPLPMKEKPVWEFPPNRCGNEIIH